MKNIAYVQAKLPSQIKPKEINMSDVDELLKRLDRRSNLNGYSSLVPDKDCIESAATIRQLQSKHNAAYAKGLEDAAKWHDARASSIEDANSKITSIMMQYEGTKINEMYKIHREFASAIRALKPQEVK